MAAEEIITNHWAFITPNVESSGEYLVSLFDPFCSLRFRWILKLGGSANKPWKVASCHGKFTINNKLLGMICQKIISYNSKMKVHLLHKNLSVVCTAQHGRGRLFPLESSSVILPTYRNFLRKVKNVSDYPVTIHIKFAESGVVA